MRIVIFGGAGTGKTTLGRSLAQRLGWSFLDSDDYYWEKTMPPYEKKIPLAVRNKNLMVAFAKSEHVVVSGFLSTWSKFWDTAFDLAVFLRVPKEIRMNRLIQREIVRYGNSLIDDANAKNKSKEFLDWAEGYEDESNGSGITEHLNWIEELDCPVVKIKGDLSNEERLSILLKEISIRRL